MIWDNHGNIREEHMNKLDTITKHIRNGENYLGAHGNINLVVILS